MTLVLLDTDIGTDIDDACALAFALRSPEIDLLGVTIVSGDVDTRAGIALRMLEAAGRPKIPVSLGAREPLFKGSRFAWAGYEGKGSLDLFPGSLTPSATPAWQFTADSAAEKPHQVVLVPIGPLTNVALAIQAFPRLRETVKEIVLMGGNARSVAGAWKTPVGEYNVAADPEAARIVFDSGIPITMVGLDVTLKVRIRREMVGKLRDTGDPLARIVAEQLSVYLDTHRRDETYMHDPLAIARLVDPTLCRTEDMDVRVETRGECTRGMTVCTQPAEGGGNARVCLDVDAGRFEELLCRRLLGR